MSEGKYRSQTHGNLDCFLISHLLMHRRADSVPKAVNSKTFATRIWDDVSAVNVEASPQRRHVNSFAPLDHHNSTLMPFFLSCATNPQSWNIRNLLITHAAVQTLTHIITPHTQPEQIMNLMQLLLQSTNGYSVEPYGMRVIFSTLDKMSI